EHQLVDEPAAVRAQAGVQPAAELDDLGDHQALLDRQVRVGVADDPLRLGEHALVGHQDGNGGTATSPPCRELVQGLDVRFLDVREPGAVQRPPGLFAEVADRDGDEPPQRPTVTVTYAI